MKLVCSTCTAKYSISAEQIAGKVSKVRCRTCGEMIVVRGETLPEPPLRAQRQENSVLFSLADVASLATSAANQTQLNSRPGEEPASGSGLLDIRSMASVYLADKGKAASHASIANDNEDLPAFHHSAFESASPLLLPVPVSGPGPRLLYALAGVAAALVVAAAVLLVLVLQSDGTRAVAQAEVPLAEVTPPVDVAEPPAIAAMTSALPDSLSETESGGSELLLAPEADAPTGKQASGTKKRPTPSNKKSKPTAKKSTEIERPSVVDTCDQVTCLVSPETACCQEKERKRRAANPDLDGRSKLAQKLGRSDIKSGMRKVHSRFQTCGRRHGGQGSVRVHAKIGGDGRVKQSRATGGNARLRACILSVVKGATFKKTREGMAVRYPVVFR